MRLTIVTETYSPQVNGVSRTLSQLVRVLEAAGDSVQVVHPRYGHPEAHHHVHVRALRLPFYRELYLPVPPFRRAHRQVDQFRPDLIHIATEATLGWSMLRFARRRRIPVVSSFHTNFDQYASHYGCSFAQTLVWNYLRTFHNRTLETYAPSRSAIDCLQSRGFERLVLWPRGVDSQLFRPDRPRREALRAALGFSPRDVVIGHVGRIAVEKNLAYLGEALSRVSRLRPNVRILIVGDGPSRPELESRLGASARFVGYRWGEDLADHYSAADIFAFSSVTETFGNVVLEAMSSGLPVVALRAGGPGEFVHDGETGTLLEPSATPDDFAQAIVRLVDDAEVRTIMGEAAHNFALTQSWDHIMLMLRGRYQEIVAAPAT